MGKLVACHISTKCSTRSLWLLSVLLTYLQTWCTTLHVQLCSYHILQLSHSAFCSIMYASTESTCYAADQSITAAEHLALGVRPDVTGALLHVTSVVSDSSHYMMHMFTRVRDALARTLKLYLYPSVSVWP